jgi:hypothetical protein
VKVLASSYNYDPDRIFDIDLAMKYNIKDLIVKFQTEMIHSNPYIAYRSILAWQGLIYNKLEPGVKNRVKKINEEITLKFDESTGSWTKESLPEIDTLLWAWYVELATSCIKLGFWFKKNKTLKDKYGKDEDLEEEE